MLNQPTFYFIGVSTRSSAIMQLFPRWMRELDFPEITIKGVDLPLHAPATAYQQIVREIAESPHLWGGLVTTHKIDLFNACSPLFAQLDHNAQLCGEISCISKRAGQLHGSALDPISSGLALDEMIGSGYFGRSGGDLFCLGAGGAATAIARNIVSRVQPADRPKRFIVVDIAAERLKHMQKMLRGWTTDIEFDYRLSEGEVAGNVAGNDDLLASLPAHSLIINATGMGKDRPGSPVSDAACFPENALVWELNYRGELHFLQQARGQSEVRTLQVYDGWRYFLHGWTQHIAHVLDIAISSSMFQRLARIADELR